MVGQCGYVGGVGGGGGPWSGGPRYCGSGSGRRRRPARCAGTSGNKPSGGGSGPAAAILAVVVVHICAPTKVGAEDLVELPGEVGGAGGADLAQAGGLSQDVQLVVPAGGRGRREQEGKQVDRQAM